MILARAGIFYMKNKNPELETVDKSVTFSDVSRKYLQATEIDLACPYQAFLKKIKIRTTDR